MNPKDKKELHTLAAELLAAQVKPAKAVPVPVPVVISVTLHKLVLADVKAFNSMEKAAGSEYAALVAIIKAAPFTDLPLFGALCTDLKTCYGVEHKDAAQIRINILNNARKIAHGAKVDGKWIAGSGMVALTEIVDTMTSIRTLKPALQLAKPAGAKVKSGGARTDTKGKAVTGSPVSAKVAPAVTLADDRKTALQAAMSILKHVEQFLQAGSDSDTINAIEECLGALQLAA